MLTPNCNHSFNGCAMHASMWSAAEETLRLTRGRKQLGVGTVLEDLQAQQELLSARSDLVTIVTQLNQAQYGLMHSVGAPLHTPP